MSYKKKYLGAQILSNFLPNEVIESKSENLSNNNKSLNDKANISDRYSEELIEYPELKNYFQKIASKIKKN